MQIVACGTKADRRNAETVQIGAGVGRGPNRINAGVHAVGRAVRGGQIPQQRCCPVQQIALGPKSAEGDNRLHRKIRVCGGDPGNRPAHRILGHLGGPRPGKPDAQSKAGKRSDAGGPVPRLHLAKVQRIRIAVRRKRRFGMAFRDGRQPALQPRDHAHSQFNRIDLSVRRLSMTRARDDRHIDPQHTHPADQQAQIGRLQHNHLGGHDPVIHDRPQGAVPGAFLLDHGDKAQPAVGEQLRRDIPQRPQRQKPNRKPRFHVGGTPPEHPAIAAVRRKGRARPLLGRVRRHHIHMTVQQQCQRPVARRGGQNLISTGAQLPCRLVDTRPAVRLGRIGKRQPLAGQPDPFGLIGKDVHGGLLLADCAALTHQTLQKIPGRVSIRQNGQVQLIRHPGP